MPECFNFKKDTMPFSLDVENTQVVSAQLLSSEIEMSHCVKTVRTLWNIRNSLTSCGGIMNLNMMTED